MSMPTGDQKLLSAVFNANNFIGKYCREEDKAGSLVDEAELKEEEKEEVPPSKLKIAAVPEKEDAGKEELIKEVALKYKLTSRFTSFVAVDPVRQQDLGTMTVRQVGK